MQIAALYRQFLLSTGVSTDTRKIDHGKIFFALKGENFNGNLFAEEALRNGALLVIADEPHFAHDARIVVVENALTVLQQLARHHRQVLQLKVLAVCGSNGKTTTKEIISRVLQNRYRVFATQGNLNNHIGVALTLLSIPAGTEIAVVEMGANHAGETKRLCEIGAPDCGLITNNGKDHLEGYGSLDGVRKGNGELYDYLRLHNGTAFVSADQPDLMEDSADLRRVTYGESKDATYQGKITAVFPFLKISLEQEGYELETQLIGRYNFDNVMAAVAAGSYFGIAKEALQQSIAAYVPSNNRSQLLQKDGNTFILDAYNANPSSMQAALLNFTQMPVENKILILGDMLELGAFSLQEHRSMLENIDAEKFMNVVLVGKEFGKALGQSAHEMLHFDTVNDLKSWFQQQHFSGCYVLLKGSRLIGLENLVV
ncbi:MAG: UDP-N-acetylmuramoyl-tripeptide--D-alanyl-D-alanine ligase [Chitinophagales bacterium]|nr:UDP-N-acetylmuramoyl-tripeptide--D-alanyl-D-alanine ligase [Chitinophagales bacterium]